MFRAHVEGTISSFLEGITKAGGGKHNILGFAPDRCFMNQLGPLDLAATLIRD